MLEIDTRNYPNSAFFRKIIKLAEIVIDKTIKRGEP
jgi:hypothetical protein